MGLTGTLKNILLGIDSGDEPSPITKPDKPCTIKRIYSTYNEIEWAFLKGILDGERIPYFVHNEYFGSMKIGTQVPLLNQKTLMVEEQYEKRAADVIVDFLNCIQSEPKAKGSRYSSKDKIRMVVEFFIFGWIMPGRKWRGDKQEPHRNLPREDLLPIIIISVITTLIFLFITLEVQQLAETYRHWFSVQYK